MRRGIFQFFLAAIVLLQVVTAEKNGNKTSETSNEKDTVKEAETAQVSFHVRPQGDHGSRSSSHSKSSSKSHGSGTGKGYGYGSNGPQDKGHQGSHGGYRGGHQGSHGGYRGGQQGSGYGHSYEEDSKGSGEAYKSSSEEGSYRGGHQHRDASPEYSSSREEQYDNKGRYGPRYQGDESHGKGYASGHSQNRGYTSSAGSYGKDDGLPSVSPDGYIESHSSQQGSLDKEARPQELGSQGYDGPKENYGGQSYQGYQGGQQHISPNQGYGEFSARELNGGYGGQATYGGFLPITNAGGVSPKNEPYSNTIGGKGIDGNKLSLFIKQLGQLPLSQVQGKNIYESNDGKYGPGKEQQQGYLLFPLVQKGAQGGGNVQSAGYGGRESYSGYNDGKNTYGVVKDAGYTAPAYISQQSGSYGTQEVNQGRDYVGANGNYGLGGQQAGNVAYHQGKGNYAQSHEATPDGKNVNVYVPQGGVYGNEASYPKQQSGIYAGDSRYEPSVGGGHPGKATYGPSVRDGESYAVAGGHGGYDNSGKYGSSPADGKANSDGVHYPEKNGPTSEGYGYAVAGSGGDSYKNAANGAAPGGYTNLGSPAVKEYPREYRGVVNFAGGPGNGYNGGKAHAVSLDSQGKSNENYDVAANLGYGNGNQGPGKNYPMVGFIAGGDARSPSLGYGDVSPKGIEQPIAPKDKKPKSVAIILQKTPMNLPSLAPIEAFGPELGTQFKTPFKDYLGGGGGGFDFNLDSYGGGISGFDTGFKGRDTTSELLHGLDGYGGDLTHLTYANNNEKFY